MSGPIEHSPRGPSQWDRWIRCPASDIAARGIESKAGYEAAEGTVFHAMVALCLEFGFDPDNFLDWEMEVDGYLIAVDEEMCECAEPGLARIREVAAWPGWKLWVETRMDISPWAGKGEFGTGDVVLASVGHREVLIWDWKYGRGVPVYPEENYQLHGYCLGAWQTLLRKEFKDDSSDIRVQYHIEQPRYPSAGGDWDTTMEETLVFGEGVKFVVEGIELHPYVSAANFFPGEKQCAWCPVKGDCRPHAEWISKKIGMEFEDLAAGSEPPKDTEITLEQKCGVVLAQAHVKRWMQGIHDEVLYAAAMGDPTPGLRLVEGRRPPRKWDTGKTASVEKALREILGDRAFKPRAFLSPTQAEKKTGRDDYELSLKPYVFQGPAKGALVPDERNDPRPAIQSVEDMFDVI